MFTTGWHGKSRRSSGAAHREVGTTPSCCCRTARCIAEAVRARTRTTDLMVELRLSFAVVLRPCATSAAVARLRGEARWLIRAAELTVAVSVASRGPTLPCLSHSTTRVLLPHGGSALRQCNPRRPCVYYTQYFGASLAQPWPAARDRMPSGESQRTNQRQGGAHARHAACLPCTRGNMSVSRLPYCVP